MLERHEGLSAVPSDDLKNALRHLHRGELSFPLDAGVLARCGLQHVQGPMLAMLRGLDEPGVRAVLVAVLSERTR